MGDNSNDGSDEEGYIGFGFLTSKLVALYDYSYTDDDGHAVHMKSGEQYHLLEKSGDWWEVIRAGDSKDLSFYVPANYVKFIDDSESNTPDKHQEDSDEGDPGSEMSSLDVHTSLKNGVSNAVDIRENHKPDVGMDIYANSNVSTFMTNNNDAPSKNGSITVRPGMYRRSLSTDDGGDYANLETLREQVGLSPAPKPPVNNDENIYANLDGLNIQPQIAVTISPSPQLSPEEPAIPDERNCPYQRTLLNVWDAYLDPMTKRNFYIHKETKEKTWKPPRYPKAKPLQNIVDIPTSAPVSVRVDHLATSVPEGWTLETCQGVQYYINTRTQEKWTTHTDENGKPYYYKMDTKETAWELPEVSLLTPNGDPASFGRACPRSRSPGTASPQIPRSVKTQSMFLESHLNFSSFQSQAPGGLMSKSSTLPMNPTSGPAPEGGGLPKSQTLPYNLQGLTPSGAPVSDILHAVNEIPTLG